MTFILRHVLHFSFIHHIKTKTMHNEQLYKNDLINLFAFCLFLISFLTQANFLSTFNLFNSI